MVLSYEAMLPKLILSALWVIVAAMAVPLPAKGGAGSICIANRTSQALVLVVDVAGVRVSQEGAPGHVLCAGAPPGAEQGTLSVFESLDAIEGCSRRASVGSVVPIFAYASFDNCHWGPAEVLDAEDVDPAAKQP